MIRVKSIVPGLLIIGLLLGLTGCNGDLKNIFQKYEYKESPQLIKVELTFTDDEKLIAYVKGLGIEDDGQVYIGGSSMNYLYDKEGTIIGAFNYQRLIYMTVVTEENTDQHSP